MVGEILYHRVVKLIIQNLNARLDGWVVICVNPSIEVAPQRDAQFNHTLINLHRIVYLQISSNPCSLAIRSTFNALDCWCLTVNSPVIMVMLFIFHGMADVDPLG